MDLITDRTESDVLLGNEKGIYSHTDLNRVEQAVSELAAMITALGFSLVLDTKTDWGLPGDFSIDAWPVETQMKRYVENVAKIRKVFVIQEQIPETMENLNWQGANSIEKVLKTAYTRIEGIRKSYRYSGEIYAGEEIL